MRIVDALVLPRAASAGRGVSRCRAARKFGGALALSLALPLLGLAGCGGGGGEKYGVDSNPVVIQNANLPTTQSGELVNYLIPFSGGGGGPYLLELIDGVLPPGLAFNNATVALVGRILDNGEYDFRLKLTDTGVKPFLSTTQQYHWSVSKGPLVFGTDANLPSYIFNRFDVLTLILAGGTAPYSCEVIDDLSNPNDELLPNGLSIPADSVSIVGAPVGVKAIAPFIYKVSIRATDSTVPTPLTVVREFTITVLVPDVVITTASVINGICGQSYTSKVNIVDGIAPFFFTVVDAPGSGELLVGEPGTPALPLALPAPQVPATPAGFAKGTVSAGFTSAYEIDSSNGSGTAAAPSYSGRFPEGVYMRESSGDILGIPRRRGTFANWNFHVQSSVLPLLATQNKWKQYTFSMADSVPVNVALDNSVLLTGNVFNAPGNNFFQGPSKGQLYSKQFLALNGCGQDAKFDAPHEGQAIANPGEAIGRYDFTGTVFASGVPAGMTFSGTGLFSGTATGTSVFQTVTVSAEDSQLPTPRSAAHKAVGTCQFEIGPDIVVITETSTGDSGTLYNNNSDMNSQTVELLIPTATGPIVRALAATDMVLTRTHPVAGGTLVGSLANIDFLRVSVNPTWWAYDGYNLNSRGARTMQHADSERRHPTDAFGSDVGYTFVDNPPSNHNQSREHASNPAIALPRAPTVTNSPATGVYNNGGLLYGYDNATEFGFFIVRKDSLIDIPVAFNKSASGFTGFGDGWIKSDRTYTGQFRIPQITVSPDGRMAAVKMKVDIDSFLETAGSERVVLFSLTGETMFGGATFVALTTGGSGNSTDGQYLYGSSLTLTNYGLYALRGNNVGTIANNGDRVIYAEHWVWKAQIFNTSTFAYLTPTTMALLGPPVGANVGGWLNTASNPVSCCFQRWMTHGSSTAILGYGNTIPNSGLLSSSQSYEAPTSAFTTGGQTNTGGSVIATSPDFWHYSYANFGDSSGAPHPFRVSQNGHACAIVGGANQSAAVTTAVGSVAFLMRSVYVDYDNNFREAASGLRRYKSGARSVGLYAGEPINRHYGWFDGPATQFEISDDGLNVAAVYNAGVGSWTTLMYSNVGQADTREELIVMRATSATPDPYATKSNTLVTNGIFASNFNWRLGCLAFTRNNTAFTFWAGVSVAGCTTFSYPYLCGDVLAGSLYAYTLGSGLLEGILPTAQGGHIDISGAAKTYSVGVPNNYAIAAQTNNGGAVKPGGSFFSNDGKFYWIECTDSIDPSASNHNSHRLIGVNVGDLTTTINTRVPLRAFAPTWSPNGKAFSPGTTYPYSYPGQYYYSGGAFNKIATNISCAGTNGLIFYASYMHSQSQPAQKNSSTSSWSGGSNAIATGWNSYYGSEYYAELFGIDASLGGSPSALTTLGNSLRMIPYIQPSEDGKRVAFITSANGTNHGNYETVPINERLSIISGVTVSGTGTLSATAPLILEGTSGRVGSSLALDTSGSKIYYAFSSNGNENGMVLKETTLNSTGTAIVGTPRTFNGIGGTSNRFAVLWSGR